jgi:hypothetical protein
VSLDNISKDFQPQNYYTTEAQGHSISITVDTMCIMYHNERDIVAVPFETREAMRWPLFELFLACYGQRRYFSMPGARKNIQVSYNHIILKSYYSSLYQGSSRHICTDERR